MSTYSLDDLQIDIGDLSRLLGTTYGVIHEMPFEREGKRDHELDQVAALLRIARDFAERISKATDTHYHQIRQPRRMTGGERLSA